MLKIIVPVGSKFGKLTVVRETDNKVGSKKLVCECECGRETLVMPSNLRSGNTTSCGCAGRFNARKHGKAGTYLHSIWGSMIQRCCNPNSRSYRDYGGRGISVDQRWRSFDAFMKDMGDRPTPKHTLERKDNDGPYSKENCCWAIRAVQSRNKRNNRMITANGRTQCLQDWANEMGLKPDVISQRIAYGWSESDAINIPLRGVRSYKDKRTG